MEFTDILKAYKTIAVVGVSDKPNRPSHSVTRYMIQAGYTIVPINPNLDEVFGQKCYPRLTDLPEPVRSSIDIVNIFRKPGDVPEIIEEAIAIGAKSIWMQLGITNDQAAEKAREAGLWVVQNHCIAVDHQNYIM